MPVPTHAIAVLRGDQTGEELLQEALRVLDPAVIELELRLLPFDLSLEHRRATQNQVAESRRELLDAPLDQVGSLGGRDPHRER